MTQAPSSYGTRDPNVFSRGSLNFTYELLRENDAELAQIIHDILQSDPLPRNNESQITKPKETKAQNAKTDDVIDNDDDASDHFKVILNPMQIHAILEALFLHDEQYQDTQNICQEIMGQALIEDWTKLAYQMLAEQPKEQQSSTMH
ncbi:MAG: hypothetical protein V7776_11285 [Halopseudomonas aestusnigri]